MVYIDYIVQKHLFSLKLTFLLLGKRKMSKVNLLELFLQFTNCLIPLPAASSFSLQALVQIPGDK